MLVNWHGTCRLVNSREILPTHSSIKRATYFPPEETALFGPVKAFSFDPIVLVSGQGAVSKKTTVSYRNDFKPILVIVYSRWFIGLVSGAIYIYIYYGTYAARCVAKKSPSSPT